MPGFLIYGRNYQREVFEPLMVSSTFRFLNLDVSETEEALRPPQNC